MHKQIECINIVTFLVVGFYVEIYHLISNLGG